MFCSKCGTKIPENSKFCPKCGISLENPATPEENLITLSIVRASQFFLVNPPINIIVDESQNFQIENGSTINIQLPSGKHTVSFSCSIRNNILDIVLNSNMILGVKFDRLTGGIKVKEGGF